jgi:hypothetical protein
MAGNYPDGVTAAHPHFNPPEDPACRECGGPMSLVAGDFVCDDEDCDQAPVDPAEAYEPPEPDFDSMPGGADHYG